MTVLVSIIMMSCKNKVSDKLSTSDVKSLIEKDTLYEKLIPRIQKIQDTISKNVLLNAKYSDITYQQCLDYEKEKNKEKDVFIEKHKKDVDKKIVEIKNRVESFRKMMNIEFHSTSIFFYDYIGGVKDGYFKFKITVPEPIQGGSFTYSIKDKSTGKEVTNGGCRFSEYIKDSYIAVYEIPYRSKDEFGYQTISEIKNNYISLSITARFNGGYTLLCNRSGLLTDKLK